MSEPEETEEPSIEELLEQLTLRFLKDEYITLSDKTRLEIARSCFQKTLEDECPGLPFTRFARDMADRALENMEHPTSGIPWVLWFFKEYALETYWVLDEELQAMKEGTGSFAHVSIEDRKKLVVCWESSKSLIEEMTKILKRNNPEEAEG